MRPLTLADVLAHQAEVPWPELYQVEQDLLLSLAMRAIFEDPFLATQVAMRGGTVLHKVHLAPASRYSEDIDLVAVGDRPEGHIQKALMRVLRPVLGKEQSSVWTELKLAVRNAARPSRILRCIYKVPSAAERGRELVIEVETNVSERQPRYELQTLPFEFRLRHEVLRTRLKSYDINEMLATKLRAMLQRRRGRDLFDIFWALTARSLRPVSVSKVVAAFQHYLLAEGTRVTRGEFVAHLRECLGDRTGFCTDMVALLRTGVDYDPDRAGAYVEEHVLSQLPEPP